MSHPCLSGAITVRVGGASGVHVFGVVGLATPNGELPLGASQRQLLAVLVAAGRDGLTKQQLYRQLDPAAQLRSGEQSAVMRVHRLRAKIRQVTGVDVIASSPRYRLDHSLCPVDWWDLEAATRRADVERMLDIGAGWGEPFGGLDDEPITVTLARQKAREIQHLALCLLAAEADVGRLEPVASELVYRFTARRYDERLASGAATALYRVGRLPEALAVIVSCRRELQDTHGLQGRRQLDEIELTILNNDLVRGPPSPWVIDRTASPTPDTGPLRPGGARPSTPAEGRPFVGRTVELERLQHLVTAVQRNQGVSCLIESPPGGGRTALVNELARRCRGVITICTGRARPTEGGDPSPIYGMWLEAFLDLFGVLVDLQRAHPVEDVHHEFWRLARAHLQSMAAERPLLLILEDLHSADAPSLGLLHSMLELGGPDGVMLLATARTGVATGRFPAVDHRIELPALSLNDVVDLVAFDHPNEPPLARSRFAAQVHRLSRGNALAATALSRDASPGLDPTSLAHVDIPDMAADRARIRTYLDRLLADRPVMSQVLAAASMVGFEFDGFVLAEVLVADPAEIRHHLAGAARLQLCWEVAPDRWQFDHLLIADYFDHQLGLIRPLVAGRLAQHPGSPARAMSRLVTWAGPELDREFVVGVLDRAATTLENELAFEEAAVALEHLLDVLDDPIASVDTLIRLAAATCRSGVASAAFRYRSEAFAAARDLDDHDRMVGTALAGLPYGVHAAGDPDRLEMIGYVDDERVTRLEPEQLAYWRLRLARLADRPDLADEAIKAADAAGLTTPELRLERLMVVAGGAARRIRRDLERVATELPAGPTRAGARFRVLRAALTEQDHDAATDLFEEVRAEVHDHGSARTRWAMELLFVTMTRVGLREDGPDMHHARRIGVQYGLPDAFDHWETQVWFDLWLQDRHAEALELLDAQQDAIPRNTGWHAAVALGSAHCSYGNRAHREADLAVAGLRARPDSAWSPLAAALLTETATLLGDRRLARAASGMLAGRSGQALLLTSATAYLGPVDRYLALADGARGRDPRPRLDRAAAQARAAGSRLWSERIARQRSQLR